MRGGRGRPGQLTGDQGLRVVSRFAVRGEVETFTLGVGCGAQSDDQVDDLVEDRAADAGPQQGDEDALDLRPTWVAMPA